MKGLKARERRNELEERLHKVTIVTEKGKEQCVRFPIDEDIYKGIKKEPKGIQKQLFALMYQCYVKDSRKMDSLKDVLNGKSRKEEQEGND